MEKKSLIVFSFKPFFFYSCFTKKLWQKQKNKVISQGKQTMTGFWNKVQKTQPSKTMQVKSENI